MNKNNFFKRFLSLALVLCMSLAMTSVNAFAAENDVPETPEVEDSFATPLKDGDVIAAGMKTITNSATIYLTLGSADWSTDFCVGVVGNQGARYEVILTTPNGNQYPTYIVGGSSNLTHLVTLVYAPAGTYTFTFTRLSGSATSARAIAEIHD